MGRRAARGSKGNRMVVGSIPRAPPSCERRGVPERDALALTAPDEPAVALRGRLRRREPGMGSAPLRAQDFMANNPEHLELLRRMGVSLIHLKDGRVQLVQHATQAVSAVAAEDGMRFMQEMMELSSQQQKEQLPPRAIQIVSHPYFGRVVLTAGPAQFGTDLSKSSTGVRGFVTVAEPYSGCSELTNGDFVQGRIALLQRGQCMFAEKARHIQRAGAIGGIVIDDNEGSSSDTAPLFQMAGDGRSTDDVHVPILFLFHKEGNILLRALKEYREVEVLLSDKARDRGAALPEEVNNCVTHKTTPSLAGPGDKVQTRHRGARRLRGGGGGGGRAPRRGGRRRGSPGGDGGPLRASGVQSD
ncbi:unnamed protein product [Boreogadus saida]